ncbi:hypothetical protein Btru_030725, partial [Bulinus truncatus]
RKRLDSLRMLPSKDSENSSLSVVQHFNSLVGYKDLQCPVESLNLALLCASHTGNMVLVQGLIAAGADVNCKDMAGNTPLLTCSHQNNPELARFLLDKDADVNAANSDGNTALIVATLHFGSCELIRLLLYETDVDIEHKNNKGYSALMTAIDRNYLDAVYLLLKSNAMFDTEKSCMLLDNDKLCPENIAERKGLTQIIILLKEYKKSGTLPLFQAALNFDIESTTFFCNYHFTFFNPDNFLDETILIQFLTHLVDKKVEIESSVVKITELLLTYFDIDDISLSTKLSCVELAVTLNSAILVELLCQMGKFIVSNKALAMAGATGNVDMLKLLLRFQCEKNLIDFDNQPVFKDCALHQALLLGHYECAEILLNHGSQLDLETLLNEAIDDSNESLLQFLVRELPSKLYNVLKNSDHLNTAVQKGQMEIIHILLDNGADVNFIYNGKTPLMYATNINTIDLLIERGADVNLVVNQETALHHFVNFNFFLQLQRCLRKSGGDDSDDVAKSIRDEVVRRLLYHGASVIDKDNSWSMPLITVAATWPYSLSVLQLLVEAGANVKEADQFSSVLDRAVASDSLDSIKFLVNQGAGVNVLDSYGQTPIFGTSNLEILQYLIDHGADVNIKNKKGNTPLQSCLLNGDNSEELVNLFITSGCDVNHRNNLGYTALLLAARHLKESFIDLLISSGADVNAVTKSGKSILTIILQKMLFRKRLASEVLHTLLGHDLCLLHIPPSIIHLLILIGCLSLIPPFITQGTIPTLIEVSPEIFRCEVSPLELALLMENCKLAKYFIEIRYLTKTDCSILCGNRERYRLIMSSLKRKCRKLIEIRPKQPLTLETLSFVVVSSALGFGAGRKERVKQTKLPDVLQECLLFKKEPFFLEDGRSKNVFLYEHLLRETTGRRRFRDSDSGSDVDSDYNLWDDNSTDDEGGSNFF